MRICFTYIVSIFLFAGCKQAVDPSVNEDQPLYSQPLSVPLDTIAGYKINLLTGDSIIPLVNSNGDTIITGSAFFIKGIAIDIGQLKSPRTLTPKILSKSVVGSNINYVRNTPVIIPPDTSDDQIIPYTRVKQSLTPDDSSGTIVGTEPIAAAGRMIPLRTPQPVKIQPMRFKDNAVMDIQYLDIGQGLSYSYITALFEDRNGYLWFGTDGYGICKYDGTYLATYTQQEGLLNNYISSIAEDKQGRLWIGTAKGISVFDGEKFLQFTTKDGIPAGMISNISVDRNGNIWFNSELGSIAMYDGKSFIVYSGLPVNSLGAFMRDSKGITWMANSSGIITYDGAIFNYFNKHLKFLERTYSIAEDSKGNIWFGSTLYGLIKYDGKAFTHYTENNGLSDNSIMKMIVDKSDNIWICTRYGGVNKFDGTKFTIYNTAQGLSDNKTNQLIEDSQHNIWVSTNGGGINKINDRGFSEQVQLESVGNSRVRPIIKDKRGHLWFGTEGAGLYNYDGTNMTKYIDSDSFALRGFRSALTDRRNDLWFGESDGTGLYKYDHQQFLYYTPPRSSAIYSLFEDRDNIIWIGTSSEGLAAFNGKDIVYYNKEKGFSSNRIFGIMQDKKDNCWIGTEGGGVVKFDGKMFTVFSEKQGLFCKGVTSIIEDKDENLWFGTLGAGLCKFDGITFTFYAEKQGLANNDVWSLKEDPSGRIWAGTDKGLSLLIAKYDTLQPSKKDYAVYSFGLEDGLKATDFNLNGVCIDNSGRIWWGTGKALITRDLATSLKISAQRSIDLCYIEINGKYFDFRSLADSTKDKISFSSVVPFHDYPDDLKLAYDQNHISFHFSALDLSAPHKIKYSYRLIGTDHQWSKPSAEPLADYRNLSHGNYEFQVKAIGQSQEWTKPFSYQFTIRPAWWQTWWFKAAVVLFTAFALLFIARLVYLYRLRRQRVLLEKQLAVQYERQRISAEMHDDIGAGLSGIRLLTEMTKSKIKDEDAAGEVEKIYRSVGDVSSKMKEVIWSLNTENDNLPNLVAYIQKQVRASLEHYPCQLSMDIADDIPDTAINGEARRNIFLIVKEAIHNIIKHSAADKVHVKIRAGKHLIISISDNGKGMNKETKNNDGNGMKNMQLRIQQLNGKLFIRNEMGLTLIFEIPIQPIV